MLLKNEGLILAELLLSLGCLLMLGLFFIPLLMDLRAQALEFQVEKQANQLLYEELQTSIVNPLAEQNHITVINGVEYKIILQQSETMQKEVCVNVEGSHFYLEKNFCRVTE